MRNEDVSLFYPTTGGNQERARESRGKQPQGSAPSSKTCEPSAKLQCHVNTCDNHSEDS